MGNEDPSKDSQLTAILKVIGKALLRFSVHLARLLWEATRYLARRFLDLIYAIRLVFLIRTKRRFPERAGEAESRISSLRETRTARWTPWRTLSVWRRLEVQVAVLGILVAAVFAVRSYITPPIVTPEPSSERSESQLAEALENELARAREEQKEIQKEMPKEFEEQRKAASPGQWIFYGANKHESVDYLAKSVLVPGKFNQWDDFRVTSPVVLKEGNRFRMWYTGCHFFGDDYTCGIGHAVSKDGISWEKSPEPLFVIQDPVQSKELDTVAIVRAGERYFMWYSIGADWFSGNHYGTVHLATSADGLNWTQEGTVLRTIGEGMVSVGPSALYDGKFFHLWYVDIPSQGGPTSVLHVTSSNGKEWQIAGSISLKDLGVDPGSRLWVLPDGHGGYLGFFARELRYQQKIQKVPLFGMLTSSDGNTWQRADEETFSTYYELGTDGRRYAPIAADAPAVLPEPDGLWIWFVFRTQDGIDAISVAYRKGGK